MRPDRQLRRAQAGHGDDWLMTYADTITLLLCLFVVLLWMSVGGKTTVLALPSPPVPASPITQPLPPSDTMEGNLPLHGVMRVDQASEDADADDDAPAEPAERDVPLRAHLLRAGAAAAPVSAPVSAVVRPVPAAPAISPPATRPPPQGERIITFQISSTAFFTSGLATLSDPGKILLQSVAVDLASDRFSAYQITVEGHTDDTPISTAQFSSNWELSTARAVAVVHFLLDQGLPARRLRAAGYADSFPVAPNRDAAGHAIADNQARNRRVVIRLERLAPDGL